MKNLLAISFLFILFSYGCTNNSGGTSENDVDAARNFIRSALDGDYNKARSFMLGDSLNTQLLNAFEDNYQKKMSAEDKRGYRESSIRVPDVRKVSDSISIVTYSNSYKNTLDSLKVLRINGQWVVDFKYSFSTKDSLNTTIDLNTKDAKKDSTLK